MVLKKYLIFFVTLWVSLFAFADNPGIDTASSGKKSVPSKILATKINVFKSGAGATKTKSGYCWVNSAVVARSDVWRCMVDNSIFDPCFAIKSPEMVVCGVDPSKNDPGFFLKLTQPLPKPFKIESSMVSGAWMIELDDGQVCKPYTGTLPIILSGDKEMAVQYGCQNSENGDLNGLLSDSVVSGKIWRAKKITYVISNQETKNIKIQNVKIKTVWQ